MTPPDEKPVPPIALDVDYFRAELEVVTDDDGVPLVDELDELLL